MRKTLILTMAVMTLSIFQTKTEADMNISLDAPKTGLAGNSMGDIAYDGKYIWVGTGDGLSYSPDSGKNWYTYDNTNGLNANDISALAAYDSTLWVACAYSRMIEGEPIPYGKGFNRTTNRGGEWESHLPEQVDYAGKLAYDIAFDDSMVWAACWYGGLIRSRKQGDSLIWENVFVNEAARKDYDSSYYNHLDNRFFSVAVDTFCPKDKKLKNSINDIVYDGRFLWVGTQNGLHAIDTDEDTLTYITFDTSNGLNANGVHSLAGHTSFLCAGLYSGEKEYELPQLGDLVGEGFNSTNEYGGSWDTSRTEQATDLGKFAYDIAIADTVVWAACGEGGLIRSFDWGKTWENVFVDAGAQKRYEEGNLLSRDTIISIAVDTFSVDTTVIWVGTADGLYKLVYTPGHPGSADWAENPVTAVSRLNANQVTIANMVYQRFGDADHPDSIVVKDCCDPYQGVNPGDIFEIPIILTDFEREYKIGGFELEVDFDYLDLVFVGAWRGILLTHSDTMNDTYYSWEYFAYRVLPCPLCPCCKKKILLYGQAELPNGQYLRGYCLSPENNFPETYWAVDSAKYYNNGQLEWVEVGATLVWLKFQVADSESLRGLESPLTFEWEHQLSGDPPHDIIEDRDCAENTFSACDDNFMYVSKNPLQYAPGICPEGDSVITILDFVDGGVHICPTSGELPSKSVLALGIQKHDQEKIIWASACTEGLGVASCSTYNSFDDGKTWTSYLGGVWVRDFAFVNSMAWAATDQGLKRTPDWGIYWQTFEILDTLDRPIIPSNFTSVCISVCETDSGVDTVVWAGTVDGLAKSTDDGKNWQVIKFAQSFKKAIWAGTAAGIFKFIYNYREDFDTVFNYNSLEHNITGDFVVSTAIQEYDGNKIIWAGTQPAYSGGNGASMSADDGDSWSITLEGDQVWNFAFDGPVVWAATSSGLKRSSDGGKSWDVFNYMKDEDEITEDRIFSSEFTSVAIIDDEVWAGNSDGLVNAPKDVAVGEDGAWNVFRTFVPIGGKGSETAYAYPSPYSPTVSDGGVVRIHHKPRKDGSVTVKIYDFAMNLVTTLVDNQDRVGGEEYDEPWDGRNDEGDTVANGVYFFRVEAPGGQTEWGKLVILK